MTVIRHIHMNLITDLTRWIGANMDSWSRTPAYPGTAIRQSKPATLGCALLFHIHKTEENIHHAKQHNLLKSEGLSCKHHFHFYHAKRDAEYWEFFYLGIRKGEQRLGWKRRHLPEIEENLHKQQFKGNHDNKHNHNLVRENCSESVRASSSSWVAVMSFHHYPLTSSASNSWV